MLLLQIKIQLHTTICPLFSVLLQLKLVTDLTPESHKTKLMQSTLQELLPASKKVLLVDGDKRADVTLLRATSNLHRANVLPVLVR